MELHEQINQSETEKSIKDETLDTIKKGNEILKNIKKAYGETSEKYTSAIKEYEDIQNKIIESLKEDQKITSEELGHIKTELGELKTLDDVSDNDVNDNNESANQKILEEADSLLKQIEDREGNGSELYQLALNEYNEIKKEINSGESKYIEGELLDLEDLNEISLVINNGENRALIAVKIDHLLSSSGASTNFSELTGLTEEEIIEELGDITENKKNIILNLIRKIDFVKNSEQILKSVENIDYVEVKEKISKLQEIEQNQKEHVIIKTKKTQVVEIQEDTTSYDLGDNDFSETPSGGYTFKNPDGEGRIEVSKDEKKIIANNPEALKNLVNFYDFFNELNLEGVWTYRKELVNAIGVNTINIKDDSLKDSELLKFGNKLITVINNLNNNNGEDKKELQPKSNLNGLKAELREYSRANNIFTDEKTFNNRGEDRFTNQLRESGIIGGAYFHTMRIRELSEK